ncbi:MAG: MFS transporter [Candidatus Eremiobacteraeota bacterium]|nr:MFS transporter [Candidatus Eremiobacteraeota bacterium]MBC5803169.1 MFS transporter [Candidatus Eremiobacteraeota bacterium]MBC5822956.1 MFS transporter [Candidatus Eremiobacteraeota bacterium]
MTTTAGATAASGETNVAGHRFDRAHGLLLLTLGLGVFAGALDLGVLSPALPAIAHAFGITPRAVAWTFTLYLFANVVSIPIAAKFSDSLGRRPVYTFCVALFGVGSVLAIAAPSFAVFLLARVIQAAGAGGIFPVATAAIADRVPSERRGSALGMLGAVWGLAAIIGPNVGGIVTHFFSWHWIFAANVPLALIVIALAQRHVPSLPARARGPLDIAGITTLAVGLLGVMVGLTRLDARTALIGNEITFAGLAVSLAAFVALFSIERRAVAPIIAPGLFATRQLIVTYGLEVLIGLLEGALFFIPAALVAGDRLTAAGAGGIAAIGALMFVVVIPLAGRALDAVGSRVVLLCGAALTALGLGLFAAALQTLWLAVAGITLAGIGFGALLGAPTRYIITNEVPGTMRATAVGVLSVFLIMGQIVGGSLAGGAVGGKIDDVAGYRFAYATFAALAAVTALLTLLLAPRAQERNTREAGT